MPGVREVFHARFVGHAYPRHTHDTWTLFIVDEGSITYQLDGADHGAWRPVIGVLPPGVAHDGHPGTADGFRKRVLYLETTLLGEHLVGRAADRPAIVDTSLRLRISAVHRVLDRVDDALEAETRMAFIAERIRCHLRDDDHLDPHPRPGITAEALRAYLDDHWSEAVTLASAADVVGASPTHMARSFSRAYGIPPHTYQIGKRIDAARRWLLDGMSPAQVAVAVGFVDQAHLTRHFKRHLGTTPTRFTTG